MTCLSTTPCAYRIVGILSTKRQAKVNAGRMNLIKLTLCMYVKLLGGQQIGCPYRSLPPCPFIVWMITKAKVRWTFDSTLFKVRQLIEKDLLHQSPCSYLLYHLLKMPPAVSGELFSIFKWNGHPWRGRGLHSGCRWSVKVKFFKSSIKCGSMQISYGSFSSIFYFMNSMLNAVSW